MTPAETVAWGALLDAISGHLPAPGPGPEQDVRLACAAIIGWGCGPDMVAKFTAELNAQPGSTSWGAACQSCGNTVDLDTVHRPAEYGIAARTEFYCHNATECAKRRHAHAVATSGVAS